MWRFHSGERVVARGPLVLVLSCAGSVTVKTIQISRPNIFEPTGAVAQKINLGTVLFFMPPTSKKLEGHIASGLFVRPSICPSVRPFVTLFNA